MSYILKIDSVTLAIC